MAHAKGSGSHGAVPGRNASIAKARSNSDYDDGLWIVPPLWPNLDETRKYEKLKIEDLEELLVKFKEWAADTGCNGVFDGLEKAYKGISHIVDFYYNDGVFKSEYE